MSFRFMSRVTGRHLRQKVFAVRTFPPGGMARLKEHCQLTVLEKPDQPTREELLAGIRGMDGLMTTHAITIDQEVLDAAGPQLKVIGTFSVGLEHMDLDLCKERGVKVGYTPDVLSNAVAEMAITLVMATARRLPECISAVKDGVWGTRWENALWLAGKQVSGSVVGIVGLGRIGSAIARRLAAFEVSKILYTGRAPKPATAQPISAEFVPFDELLEQSDFVIVSCSANDSNTGLFNADAFKKMKSSSIFVNISRGTLVDQESLYEALTSGQIGAAGLEVTQPEPLPPSHRLLTLPNCLVSPHIGSATIPTREAMCHLVVDNILAGLEGRPLKTPAY